MSTVLVEVNTNVLKDQQLETIEKELKKNAPSFEADHLYPVVPMQDKDRHVYSIVIKGNIEEKQMHKLKASKAVLEVFPDDFIAPF